MTPKTTDAGGATELSRRDVVALGIAGAAALLGASPDEAEARSKEPRMPVAFLPHGGGPWPWVELGLPKSETDSMAAYLRGVPKLAPRRPTALLVVSAHWEQRVPTVLGAAKPPMLYDYVGFPPEAYRVTWPAPGAPALAARVRLLLGAAGFETATDASRGFDHGTFVPLKLAWEDADIPTIQLSLISGLDPGRHLAMGRALAPLRDEGVFILGSGMSYHNMRGFFSGSGAADAEAFDAWLGRITCDAPAVRDAELVRWAAAPSARACHPREEHLLPLLVCAGAAGADRGALSFRGATFGKRVSGFHFG